MLEKIDALSMCASWMVFNAIDSRDAENNDVLARSYHERAIREGERHIGDNGEGC
jgi:hypothetical protein